MPFNDNLPAENVDPWYGPLVTAWNNLKTFVNGLETALGAKADDTSVVKLSGAQTIAGVKTFSSAPAVPDAAFSIAKTNGLQTALDGKADDAQIIVLGVLDNGQTAPSDGVWLRRPAP